MCIWGVVPMTRGDLVVDNVVTGYGRVQVLRHVDLTVSAGDRIVLLGRNGMGETAVANMVGGLLAAWSGSVTLDGHRIEGRSAYRRIWDGIGYVPQGRGLFRSLTVMENLQVGLHGRRPRRGTVAD